jgi:hypothetical protein
MIVNGFLESVSDGMKVSGGFAQREYIKIGNARLPEICTSSYIDNILLESVGTDVTISMKKSLFMGNFITAIKESNGEITRISKGIIFSMFLNKLIVLIGISVILTIIGFIVAGSAWRYILLGAIFLPLLISIISTMRAKKTIKEIK